MATLAACTRTEVAAPDDPPPPAPSDDTDDEPDRTGGTLRIGLSIDPVSVDPRFVADEEGEFVVAALFEPLVTLDDNLRVVPAAAARWDVDEDGAEFTFHLREASFHDGTPVTADDFVRTFRRIADGTAEPRSFLAYLLEPIQGVEEAQADGEPLAGVEALDDQTLVIRLSRPEPGYLRTLTNPSLAPTPPQADDVEAFGAEPIGNGPFLLAEARDPDSAFLRLARYADHRSPPLLDEVVFQIYRDDPAGDRQWEDFVEGQLQIAEVPSGRLDEAAETYGTSRDGYTGPGLLTGTASTVYLYGFDTTREPFDNPAVRRAISLAIDREALARDVMQATRAAADAIVPPPIPGAQPGACQHCRHDPEAARAELEEAEVELERLTLTHNRGRTHAAIAEAMATDLEAALDVEVELESMDLRPFIQAVRRGDVPFFRLGWEVGEPDPGAYLYPLFHSSQVGLDNLTRFADEEVDALLDQARAATNAATALSHYRKAERRILEDAPVLPLLWYRHSRVVAPEVQDFVLSPLGRMDLARVWLERPSA